MSIDLQIIVDLIAAFKAELSEIKIDLFMIRAALPRRRAKDMYRWN